MTTEKTATKRLLKKLSALRVTLPTEEQNILDSFILTEAGEEEEVEAHKLSPTKISTGKANAGKVSVHKASVRKHLSAGRSAMPRTTMWKPTSCPHQDQPGEASPNKALWRKFPSARLPQVPCPRTTMWKPTNCPHQDQPDSQPNKASVAKTSKASVGAMPEDDEVKPMP
jgi:hypothetical protein